MSTTSVWMGTSSMTPWPVLSDNLTTETVVVGGGITGVTVAWLLAQAGRQVVLLEAARIGAGDTGHSTGNLYQTVSTGLHAVCRKWGDEVTAQVAQSRKEAIDFIEQRAAALGPQCAFQRCPMYYFATVPEAAGSVQDEYEAARMAGVPARLSESVPVDLPAAPGAVLVLDHQAQFHPLGYVRALAADAASAGARLFEHSPVVVIDRDQRIVQTSAAAVLAHEIVLATHSPSGFHFVQAGMMPGREYGLAFATAGRTLPPGIFWAEGTDRLSVRGLDAVQGCFVIAVGARHTTGQWETTDALTQLVQQARSQLGLDGPAFRWSGQHFRSPDGLPYIGPDASDAYIATGFGTDGLVYGTLAAHLIADQILQRGNRWSKLYKPGRFAPVKAGKGVLKETKSAATALLQDYLTMRRHEALHALEPGCGAIVEIEGERGAAFRAPDGSVQLLSPVCTHLHCMVRWNSLEKSWDCPCHGSRFAPDGQVLEGPALAPLSRQDR